MRAIGFSPQRLPILDRAVAAPKPCQCDEIDLLILVHSPNKAADLIGDRIESESTVVDLLDYDVRFGQGFLFSPPRPVRAEALQGLAGDNGKADSARSAAPPVQAAGEVTAAARSGTAQLARAASARN